MIENVLKTAKFFCDRLHLNCYLSNAEDFILNIGEDEKERIISLEKFEEEFPWDNFEFAGCPEHERDQYEDFLEYFSHKIGWKEISKINLSKKFIIRNKDNLDWITISRKEGLTEEDMEMFQDKIDWKLASFNQKMSEEFIERHSDKMDWTNISLTKKLSEKFINKHSDKLNLYYARMTNKESFLKQIKSMY